MRFDQTKIRYRYIRVIETVRNEWNPLSVSKQEHVLTLATALKDDKLYVGYSLNRTPKIWKYDYGVDKFNPHYGRNCALGRLNSSKPLVINVDKTKPMIKNIVDGLLALPTTKDDVHVLNSVPSALKVLLKKNLREYNKSNTTV